MQRFSTVKRRLLSCLTGLLATAVAVSAQEGHSTGRSVGPETAAVTVEVFSDFQCPYCKNLEEETLTRVREEYARSGKIRLVHRDFPLSMHAHAREAAQYAAAADRIGKFEEVAEVLFRQQDTWAASGQVEETVASVLTPDQTERVRQLTADPATDTAVNQDIELGQQLQIDSTPTIIIRHGGQAYRVAGAVGYPILSRFLDQLLAE